MLELVIRTATDLPPDVRAAMKAATLIEPADTRSGQALAIINVNIDEAANGEGPICQDTGMPIYEIHLPRGSDELWMADQIRLAVAEATRLGKLRPNSVDSITGKNSGNNLGPGTPVFHFRAVGEGGDRGEADAQGRRLRELQRAVLGARRAVAPGPRRPQPGGRAQVHPARRLGGPGQGVQPGRHRRLRRRRSRVGVRPRQGPALPHARRREPGAGAGGARSRHHGHREPARDRRDGVPRAHDAHRLQDRRAEPAAGELLRLGGVRLLGVPPPRRRPRRHERGDRRVAVPRPVEPGPADGQRSRALRAPARKWS